MATVPETYHKHEMAEIIRIKDLPPKVLAALPKQYDRNEFTFTYKRKLKDGVISYDADYEKGGEKFSMAYDEQGRMVEQEKKVEFSDIPQDLKLKVEKVLSAHYPDARILMVEEAVFEYQTGEFREFIHMRVKSIETLN